MINITTRPESPSDAPSIGAVTITAFLNAEYTRHTVQLIVNGLRMPFWVNGPGVEKKKIDAPIYPSGR